MNDRRPRTEAITQNESMGLGVAIDVAEVMRGVYGWMTAGLIVTAFVAVAVAQIESLQRVLIESPGLFLIAFVVEIGLVLAISAGINRLSPSTAGILFLVYSAVNGITFSFIFLAFSGPTIASAFVATAAMFGAMSIVGFTTRKDLSGLGSILFMGLIGLIVALVLSMLIPGLGQSRGLYLLISLAGVVIFTLLTAYDTQKIKTWAEQGVMGSVTEAAVVRQRISIYGALTLYLDFINLFIYLLRLISALSDN